MTSTFLLLALAQVNFEQRGFFDTTTFLFPQTTLNDRGRVVTEGLLRYETIVKLPPSFRFSASVDAQADTHRQTQRTFDFAADDRTRLRPAFSLRTANLTWTRGYLSITAGKQQIRWGKTDVLHPTDRFSPQDFVNVARADALAVTGARLTYGGNTHTFDLAVTRFTPSRVPLFYQRWANVPEGVLLTEDPARFPARLQWGARWNANLPFAEFSFSYFEGFNHLPYFQARITGATSGALQRAYSKQRMWGADFAKPLPWLTLKAEAAYFRTLDGSNDDYVIYVVEAERQWGEWTAVVGYAGERVTEKRLPFLFAPDRGLTRAAIGTLRYTVNPRSSLALEFAVRQNGDGAWVKGEYSRTLISHLRLTVGYTTIHGQQSDFLGQYQRNSHGFVGLRYSF